MKEYKPHSTKWFKTNLGEIMELIHYHSYAHSPRVERYNLKLMNTGVLYDQEKKAIEFTVRKVPEKKNAFDNAFLMIVRLNDDSYWAKRHHRNQYLKLAFDDYEAPRSFQ